MSPRDSTTSHDATFSKNPDIGGSAALTKTISPGACFAGLEGRLGQNGAEERINLSRGQTCIMS